MNFHYLKSVQEQEDGVRGKTLTPEDAYVFMPLSPGGRFVMDGVNTDLDIVFINVVGTIIGTRRMVKEKGGAEVPPDAFAAIEGLPGILDRADRRSATAWNEVLEGY
jgi:hypothetical protein